jgi:hypothetical protein
MGFSLKKIRHIIPAVTEWKPTEADYEWEIERIDLDELEVDLRLLSPTNPRTIHLIPFDIADYHDWKVGDHVAIDAGPMSPNREIQKSMGMRMSEEDYTLFNKRTGGKAISRKNDWEV